MAIVRDIYEEIQSKTNKPLNVLTIRRRINEAIDFFSGSYERMAIKKRLEVKCDDPSTYYDVPMDITGISKVLDGGENEFTDFEVLNNSIKFGKPGIYTLIANVKPNLVKTKDSKMYLNEELKVNPLFIRPIIFYVLSIIEDDYKKAIDFMNMATSQAQEANLTIKKQDKIKGIRRMKAPLWR